MTVLKNVDCASDAASYEYLPIFWACFGPKNLPSQFNAVVGPTTQTVPGNPPCDGWPSAPTPVTLGRLSCNTYSWGWSNLTGGYLNLNCGLIPPIMGGNASMNPITAQMTSGTYWYILDGVDITGSCSYNPETRVTVFNMSGFVLNSNGCKMAFSISYNGV